MQLTKEIVHSWTISFSLISMQNYYSKIASKRS